LESRLAAPSCLRPEIGRALNGSRLGGTNKGTHFAITGYQSTHNVGGGAMGSDPSTQRRQ
jgi:hypothetical protein